jgi:hypothetical protein
MHFRETENKKSLWEKYQHQIFPTLSLFKKVYIPDTYTFVFLSSSTWNHPKNQNEINKYLLRKDKSHIRKSWQCGSFLKLSGIFSYP